MPISERDIKLLWGRAASRCAFPNCRTNLTQDKNSTHDSFVIGTQAHIVGENAHSPRGKSLLSVEERESYFNHILLCPNHHTQIDRNTEDYPVEKLHIMKAQHELWVEQNLSGGRDRKKEADEIIYADLVDAAVKYCYFEDWDRWTGGLMSAPPRHCALELESDVRKYGIKILRAVWPNSLQELERSLKTLSYVMQDLMEKFGANWGKHIEMRDNELWEMHPGNRLNEWNPPLYDKLAKEHESWGDEVDALVIEATKAANWVADVVRRDINTLFFATQGKFTITYGPVEDLRTRTILPAYTNEQRTGFPYDEKYRLFIESLKKQDD